MTIFKITEISSTILVYTFVSSIIPNTDIHMKQNV